MSYAAGGWSPIDFREVYWLLMHGELHLRPWEIRAMTQGEIADALDAPDPHGKPRQPRGGVDLSAPGASKEFVERRRSMTRRERVAELRRS